MEKKFKYQIGMYLIFCHLSIIVSILILRLLNGFIQEEFSTLLGIIVPMFSGFTTSIIMFIIADRNNTQPDLNQKPLTFSFRFLFFIFPTLFVVSILTGIWLQGYKLAFTDFENFKSYLLSVESLFSIYCGYFVYSLFDKVKPAE